MTTRHTLPQDSRRTDRDTTMPGLPAELSVSPAGDVFPVPTGADGLAESLMPQKTDGVVRRALSDLEAGLTDRTQAGQLVSGSRRLAQIVTIRMGVGGAVRVARPQHAETFLLPAAEALCQTARGMPLKMVNAQVPVDDIETDEEELVLLRSLLSAYRPLIDGMEARSTQLESRINETVRLCYDRVKSTLPHDSQLADSLGPVTTLVKSSAEAAADSRKSNARLVSDTERKTRDAFAAAQPASSPQPSSTPTTPPPSTTDPTRGRRG